MACLREQTNSEDVQCNEEGCAFRFIPVEVNREFDGYPSPDDCVLQKETS